MRCWCYKPSVRVRTCARLGHDDPGSSRSNRKEKNDALVPHRIGSGTGSTYILHVNRQRREKGETYLEGVKRKLLAANKDSKDSKNNKSNWENKEKQISLSSRWRSLESAGECLWKERGKGGGQEKKIESTGVQHDRSEHPKRGGGESLHKSRGNLETTVAWTTRRYL